jgi:hypothetical protein
MLEGLEHSTSGSHDQFLLKKSTNQVGQFATNTYKMQQELLQLEKKNCLNLTL